MTLLDQPRARGGYTLAEMLIVVTIMIILVATALPVAKKVMDGNQTREASRQFSAYLTMAKMRALQTGRPCGLYLPFNKANGYTDNTNNTSTSGANPTLYRYWPVRQVTQVFLAEVPAPYAGSTIGARGKVVQNYNVSGQYCFMPVTYDPSSGNLIADTSEMAILSSLLNPGEQFLVRFDYKGDWYRFQYNNTAQAPYYYVLLGAVQGNSLPPGYSESTSSTAPVGALPGKAYQVYRAPRPIGNPLELPRGTCIDITYSGVGDSSRQYKLTDLSGNNIPTGLISGMYLMFSPAGGVDSVYVNTVVPGSNPPVVKQLAYPLQQPAGSLYFLLGKTEKVSDPVDLSNATWNPSGTAGYASVNDSNLADPTSLWVVVSRQTGVVTTAENMPLQSSSLDNSVLTFTKYLQAARQAAIQGEQMTGR